MDGDTTLDCGRYAVMKFDVEAGAGRNQNDVGAQLFGLQRAASRLYPIHLCLVAGSYAASVICVYRYDADGLSTQLWHQLLLHRGEVGIQIHEQPVDFTHR